MAMPAIPTAKEVRDRIKSDLETAFNQTTPILPKAFNKIIAGALSGLIILAYHAILWVYAQIFPDKADIEALVLLGKLVNITRRAAVKSVLQADVFGTDGGTVAEGTRFTGSNGITYSVTSGGTIGSVTSGKFSCELTALIAGDAGNLANGESLSIVSSDPFLTGVATVTSTVTSGDDQESVEQFRVRVVIRYKKRFTGGSPADYELWGLETPHFVWVAPYTHNTLPNTVIVYGKVDNQTDGIPTSAQLLALVGYLSTDPTTGKRNRKPTTDDLDARPISRFLLDIEIQIKGASAALKASIQSAVDQYVESREPYDEGVSAEDVSAVTDSGVSRVADELASDQNATVLQVTITETLTGTVTNNYLLYGGEFAKMNSLTFVDVT